MMMCAAMEELDGDDVRVSSRGRFAERDIVQVWQPLDQVMTRTFRICQQMLKYKKNNLL